MKKSIFSLSLLTTSILLSGCAAMTDSGTGSADRQVAYEQDRVYKLTVLNTNDNHGRFWKSGRGEWGMAARKTVIDQIRAEVESDGGYVMLLSGGDINTGVPESDLQDAVPDFKGMNLLGYNAMAVGNHEFDNSMEVIEMQRDLAEFPFLSANIYKSEDNSYLFKPYEMFEYDGLTVAVMGLTTEDTSKLAFADNVAGLEFRNPVTEAEKLVPELEKKADIIIATTHMGHYQDAEYGINAPGDVTLAREVDGIDMIVGGHSQDALFEPDIQNDTVIVQAQEWGKYVGRSDFEFKNGELTLVDYELVSINSRKSEIKYEENAEMLSLLAPYQEKGEKLVGGTVGEVDGVLVGERSKVRFGYTNMGTLMIRAQRAKTGADFGMANSGGIRASIEPGEISYKDVLTVQPFSNSIAYVDLTGAEIFDYLSVVAMKPTDSGAFAHFDGIEMTISEKGVSDIAIGGEPLQDEKVYRMSFNNYSASGGDGYPKLTGHPNYVNTGYMDAEVLKEYIEQNTPLKIADYVPQGIDNKRI